MIRATSRTATCGSPPQRRRRPRPRGNRPGRAPTPKRRPGSAWRRTRRSRPSPTARDRGEQRDRGQSDASTAQGTEGQLRDAGVGGGDRGRLPGGTARHRRSRRGHRHLHRGRPSSRLRRQRLRRPRRPERDGAGRSAGAGPTGGDDRDRRTEPADARRGGLPGAAAQRADQPRRRGGRRGKSSQEKVPLAPMNPFERKIVHDAVAAAGLTSASEGEEPRRHVVVLPVGCTWATRPDEAARGNSRPLSIYC